MQLPALRFVESGWCAALKTSYMRGVYQPKTRDEYNALASFAVNAAAIDEVNVSDASDKAALVERAIALGLGAPSVLERWSVDRLRDAISKAEAS